MIIIWVPHWDARSVSPCQLAMSAFYDRRDPSAWAAARIVGSVSQQLVSQLSAATNAEQVETCLGAALNLFIARDSEHPNASAPRLESAALGSKLLQQCLQELKPCASTLGWQRLQSLFLQDQFDVWASCVLTGRPGCHGSPAHTPSLQQLAVCVLKPWQSQLVPTECVPAPSVNCSCCWRMAPPATRC